MFLSNFTTDIDECVATPSKCHNKAACNNTHGSYVCTCKSGYIGDGRNCIGTVNSLKSLLTSILSFLHVRQSRVENRHDL